MKPPPPMIISQMSWFSHLAPHVHAYAATSVSRTSPWPPPHYHLCTTTINAEGSELLCIVSSMLSAVLSPPHVRHWHPHHCDSSHLYCCRWPLTPQHFEGLCRWRALMHLVGCAWSYHAIVASLQSSPCRASMPQSCVCRLNVRAKIVWSKPNRTKVVANTWCLWLLS